MAAITYWVDPVSGNDANSGTTFANAVETIGQTHSLMSAAGDGNDYTINLTNTGTHTPGLAPVWVDGQPNSTFLIRGTDSSGTPALTTVQPTGINTNSSGVFRIRDNNGVTVEYLDLDFSNNSGNLTFLWGQDASNTLEFRYCKILYDTYGGSQDSSIKYLTFRTTVSGTVDVYVHDCYIVNYKAWFVEDATSSNGTVRCDSCVIINYHNAGSGFVLIPTTPNSGDGVEFTNCTVWQKATPTTTTTGPAGTPLMDINANMATMTCKDNIIWRDFPDDWSSTFSATGIFGGLGGSLDFTTSEDIGYNVFLTGPNMTADDDPSKLSNYEDLPWDPGVDDLYTGDVRDDNVADTSVFNDPASTYDWTPEGSAVAITIDRDLRLKTYTDASSTGGLVGALPAAFVDPSISGATTSVTSVVEGDKLSVTFTYTEDAGDNTGGTTVSLSYPAALTLDSTKVSLGSFASDVWTITGTSVGGTATITATFSVGAVVAGTDYDVTATITAHGSGIGLGGTTSDDTDTVTFTGLAIEGGVTDPDSPSRVQYIDVLPTTEPRFKIDTNIRLRTRRNRQEEHLLRYDEEDTLFSEFRGAVVSLATNTSSTFNMGGIERASYLLYESDNAIQLAINGGTFLPSATQMAITKGAISSLKIKNPSSTDTAEVFLLVVD